VSAFDDPGLDARLAALMLADCSPLQRLRSAIAKRRSAGRPTSQLELKLETALAAAEARVAARRAVAYELHYDEALPIAAAREEIISALKSHRVVVVCGDTGSGKTTQLPKLCLEAGLGVRGMIGHTQPRRIAAHAVASRLAAELGVRVGEGVGLKVRFTDETSSATLVKVMTDGILLNEIRADRALEAYDTLIIDEAHERSLNIDFILGFLRRLEFKRPDLKIVITSATIDPERFARHFDDAPIVRVSGRSYPVEVRYRPRDEEQDIATAVTSAARELAAESPSSDPLRDMLVFLPGERWIRDAEHALARFGPKGYEVLPLYARLTTARQRRILNPGKSPRIVLATNIAETSLTVPRIRYVIDSGLARVSRYGARHRVQSLGVEPIAQANAVQRAGRCGRLGPGVCVRLFAEEDFEARPEFTDPEIVRTSLASVVLRLAALKLGPIDEFPFIDAPPTKAVTDAYQLLHLLGALDAERALTADGGIMAQLPVDPRVARLLVVANRNGVLREGLVLASALSVVDPREFGVDADAARRAHEAFADPRSEFMTYLHLWKAYRQERRAGQRALRAWCRENYLSAARLREWHDVHDQLHELVQALGWRTRHDNGDYRAIHQAVLAAFIDFIAQHEDGPVYRGMRESRAQLFAGTALAKKRPRWIVAAERVATERSFLRTVAQVNPRWALRVAPHLVRFEYHDPLWDAERGQVTAREVITLFGLTLGSERRIDYGRVAPAEARRIFLAESLAADHVGFRAADEPAFITRNRELRAEVRRLEARVRRRDLFVGEEQIASFYDSRLPPNVHDRPSLVAHCRRVGDSRLHITQAELLACDPAEIHAEGLPESLTFAGQALALRYAFEPGSEEDGATLEVPRALLMGIRPEELEWVVPAWLPLKVLALLRALPKERRRALVPLPGTVAAVMEQLAGREATLSLADALAEALRTARGTALPPEAFDDRVLDPYLRIRVAVLDADGNALATGRDLEALQRRFREAGGADRALCVPATWQRRDLAQWDIGDLPALVEVAQKPRNLKLAPTLVDRDGHVDLELMAPGASADESHHAGVRRLLLKTCAQQTALIRERLMSDRALVLAYHGLGSTAGLVDDVLTASAERAFPLSRAIRKRAEFLAARDAGRGELVSAADELQKLLHEVLPPLRRLRRALAASGERGEPPRVREEIAKQLDALVAPGFLTRTPVAWRAHLPRYLLAAEERWGKRGQRQDAVLAEQVRAAEARLERYASGLPEGWPLPSAVTEYRWLIEELRVSLFAEKLGTVRPVSAKRLERAWQEAIAETAEARLLDASQARR